MTASDASTSLLTREAFLGPPKLALERLEVPELGGAVMVREMSGDEKAAWEKSLLVRKRRPGGEVSFEQNEKINVRVSLAIACCCDANRTPLFTEADTPMLGQQSAAALERIFKLARRLNRIGEDDVAALEAEEDFS